MDRFASFDGLEIAFTVMGAGPDTLLMHGFAADAARNWVAPGIAGAVTDALPPRQPLHFLLARRPATPSSSAIARRDGWFLPLRGTDAGALRARTYTIQSRGDLELEMVVSSNVDGGIEDGLQPEHVRRKELKRTHHVVVFMIQNVAMVDVSPQGFGIKRYGTWGSVIKRVGRPGHHNPGDGSFSHCGPVPLYEFPHSGKLAVHDNDILRA